MNFTRILMRSYKELEIIRIGHPTLRKVASPLTDFEILSKNTQKIIGDMKKTLGKEDDGIGLAAPQVDISKQIVIIKVPSYEGHNIKPFPETVLINPKIEYIGNEKVKAWEGCLSVPGLRGIVHRHANIVVQFKDEKAKSRKIKASGLLSCVFQHEIDHLVGKVFLDRMTPYDIEHNLGAEEESSVYLEEKVPDACLEGDWTELD